MTFSFQFLKSFNIQTKDTGWLLRKMVAFYNMITSFNNLLRIPTCHKSLIWLLFILGNHSWYWSQIVACSLQSSLIIRHINPVCYICGLFKNRFELSFFLFVFASILVPACVQVHIKCGIFWILLERVNVIHVTYYLRSHVCLEGSTKTTHQFLTLNLLSISFCAQSSFH